MKTLAERLAHALSVRNKTPADLARAIGASDAAVSFWLSGATKALKSANLFATAEFLQCSARWLGSNEGPSGLGPESEPIDLDNHPDLVRVRTVKMRLQAGVTGFSIDGDESDGPPIFFRSDWLRNRGFKPYDLVAIKVQGSSMEPTLHPGDMVVINTADKEPKDGKAFAVNYEGEALIKRMVRDGGTWWLSSDNPDQRRYGRKECADSSCLVIGRVIHRQSEEI